MVCKMSNSYQPIVFAFVLMILFSRCVSMTGYMLVFLILSTDKVYAMRIQNIYADALAYCLVV